MDFIDGAHVLETACIYLLERYEWKLGPDRFGLEQFGPTRYSKQHLDAIQIIETCRRAVLSEGYTRMDLL